MKNNRNTKIHEEHFRTTFFKKSHQHINTSTHWHTQNKQIRAVVFLLISLMELKGLGPQKLELPYPSDSILAHVSRSGRPKGNLQRLFRNFFGGGEGSWLAVWEGGSGAFRGFIWVFPYMVVPPKHPKTIIFSRKTHGCWVPPFLGFPHIEIHGFFLVYIVAFWIQEFSPARYRQFGREALEEWIFRNSWDFCWYKLLGPFSRENGHPGYSFTHD